MKTQVIIENFCERERCLNNFIYNMFHFPFRENFWWEHGETLHRKFVCAFIWDKTPEGYDYWLYKYKIWKDYAKSNYSI